ncbi:MAG: hypothetical protein PF503_10095 [Desulfobacula sp.]|jgi:predicted metal-dependent hydrolase|nr:hypothetical protein [Desulfobacula sp.]
MLKSPPINEIRAKEAVYKKGKWRLDKLKLVERIPPGKIATGSRLLYLGRRYYVDLIKNTSVKIVTVLFNHSKDFFKELGKFIPEWKALDDMLCGMKL